jgi:LPS-assembly protein
VAPSSLFDATYRFRFDTDQAEMKRQEVGLNVGPSEFNASVNYVFLAGNEDFRNREQISGGINARFFDYWSANAGTTYDFVKDRVNSIRGGFGYNDECFGMNLSAQYSPDGDTDLSSGKFVAMITFTFKNLGDIGTSF